MLRGFHGEGETPVAETAVDELTARTGLTAQERRDRASRAGAAANTIASYVRRITARAHHLTDADLAALRGIVGPVEAAQAYAAGVRDGRRAAIDRIVRAATETEGRIEP